jgi:hypothetical protein
MPKHKLIVALLLVFIAECSAGQTASPPVDIETRANSILKKTRRVTLTLDRRAFSYYDVKKKDWNAEPGAFAVLVGSSSAKIELQGTFHLLR